MEAEQQAEVQEAANERWVAVLSLFIAMCLVGLCCAITVAIAKSVNGEQQAIQLSLPGVDKTKTTY